MKSLLAASALVFAISAPAFAQQTGDIMGNPNAIDRPSQRDLSSDELARQSGSGPMIDGTTTESILPQGSVDGTISAPPGIRDPLSNTGGQNEGSGINLGSSGSAIGGGVPGSTTGGTSGGNSAY